MDSKTEKFYSLGDIFRLLKTFLIFLLRKSWLVVIVAAIGAGIGAFYHSKQKPSFEAQCTFILEEKQSGMGGLGSIASQFGLDMGSMGGGGSLFAGDNILDILKSKKVVRQVLLSQVDNSITTSPTLADVYLDYSGYKKQWEKKPELLKVNFAKAKNGMTSVEDSILNSFYDDIVKKNLSTDRVSKKGTIISVQIKAENSLFARLMAERLVEEASKLYYSLKTGTAQTNIDRLQRRSDSLLHLLNRKSFTAAAVQPLDINPGIRAAFVPVEIATRDKTVLTALYTEVTKNLEASKLLLSQQTPVIQILDKPGMSLTNKKSSQILLILLFSFAFALVAIFFLFINFFLNKNRSSGVA